ncbi:MAG TPA: proteasome subunit alpha, partial [Gordonia sp. (in: high G+C Gram-positive bacteria)]|nr:proteasome subunit alpha [Gordonia sp. (in: high G+C Gram-positive bacteria)]
DALATPPPAANGAAESPRRELTASDLEVAILDHNRPRRAFRRLTAKTIEELLAQTTPDDPEAVSAEESTTTEDPSK